MNLHAPISPDAPEGRDIPQTDRTAPAEAITLSICIPTFNRAPFLDYALTHLAQACRFDFTYEIVISDNASTDDTRAVAERHAATGLPVVYHCQEENKGGLPNLLTVFHRARGQYLIYLADDDLIIGEALADHIHYLLDNPEIRACYTPWEVYDDLNKVTQTNFYAVDGDVVFHPGDEMDLLTLMVKNHIFPEIVVYRADAIRDILWEPRFCYWAFSYLAHIAARGPIAFRPRAYYRSVTLTPVAPDRGQAGVEQTMVDWDSYRGGLEYFVHAMFVRARLPLTGDVQRVFRDMIDLFVDARMRVALRLWIARKDYVRAYELVCRLAFLNPVTATDAPEIPGLRLLVAAQILARMANGIAGLNRLVLAGIQDGPSLGSLLRDVGLERRIIVTPVVATTSGAAKAGSLVFIANEADRAEFVAQGYVPGLIVSEEDLLSGIYLR